MQIHLRAWLQTCTFLFTFWFCFSCVWNIQADHVTNRRCAWDLGNSSKSQLRCHCSSALWTCSQGLHGWALPGRRSKRTAAMLPCGCKLAIWIPRRCCWIDTFIIYLFPIDKLFGTFLLVETQCAKMTRGCVLWWSWTSMWFLQVSRPTNKGTLIRTQKGLQTSPSISQPPTKQQTKQTSNQPTMQPMAPKPINGS